MAESFLDELSVIIFSRLRSGLIERFDFPVKQNQGCISNMVPEAVPCSVLLAYCIGRYDLICS